MARFSSHIVLKNILRATRSFESTVILRSVFPQAIQYSTNINDQSETHEELQSSNTSSGIYSTRMGSDSDTHDDFQPTNKLKSSSISIQDIILQDVKENPIMIYMKGIPDAPRCGFSALAVRVLQQYGVHMGARDILADLKLKESVKEYTKWPTFPQIFIKGEFIGGSDILLSMHQKGKLTDLLVGITDNGNQKIKGEP